MSIPSFSIDLIKELNNIYPIKNITLGTPIEHIWYSAGQRSVIDRLNLLLADDTEGLPDVLP